MNIAIEGNIGSNKKAFIRFLQENFQNIEIIQPYDKLSGEFITEPNKWAFEMGVDFLLSRNGCRGKNINVYDRTEITFNAYVKACVDMNYMAPQSGAILEKLKQSLQFPKYDVIVYIRSNPNDCYENTIERGITGIDYSFIQKLHDEYEKLFREQTVVIDSGRIENLDKNELSREYLLEFITNKIGLLPKTFIDEYDEWTLVQRKKKRRERYSR